MAKLIHCRPVFTRPVAPMPVTPFQALTCPLEGAPLQCTGTAWQCPYGHSFDMASQGYLHLLPVQHKRSRDPGDSKEMVAARRRFLNAGHYQPIAAAVARTLLADLPARGDASLLDAGCGEGYYLRQLAAATGPAQRLAVLGLDISKWAVQAAARQDKGPRWVVGSNARLPVLPASLDRILCMFGFPVFPEFARVLKPGGQVLQVDAGPEHLRQLRELIYPRLKPEHPAARPDMPGFQRLETSSLAYCLELTRPEQIADLLAMTPHLYRASPEGRARAAALERLTLQVDVRLTRLQRE
ncbi:putative RNA methyltransferase [Azovibrio restrictus]|uniref:putative RNA methyltransferase n=1 Tax=Azovibrio restrictus TaxID=146938 RepID=UPI00350E55BE